MSLRAVLEGAVARWNDGDLEGYMQLYAADARVRGAEGSLNRDATRAMYAAMWERAPGSRIDLDEAWEDGDRLGVRFTLAAPDGLLLEGVSILRFRDGRCVERITVSERRPAPP